MIVGVSNVRTVTVVPDTNSSFTNINKAGYDTVTEHEKHRKLSTITEQNNIENFATKRQVTPQQIRTHTNCGLFPEVKDIGDNIHALLDSGRHIVKLDLHIKGNTGPFERDVPGDLFDPFQWMITAGDTGRALLRLRDNFVPMSLSTMGKGVENIHVSLKQYPPNCMANFSIEEAVDYMRKRIFENFGSSKPLTITSQTQVCSRHVLEDGKLDYICCEMDDDRNMQCGYIQESIWLKILFVSIVMIQIGVVLYFPVLLPESIYTDRKTFTSYIYTPAANEKLTLTVKTVNDPDEINSHFKKTSLHSTARLERFKEKMKTLTPNRLHTLEIESVTVSARSSKILAEGTAPAGIYDFIKRFVCQCRMRLEIKSVAACCNENLFRSFPCNFTYYWYECLQKFMMLLTIAMVTIPWFLRVLFYYKYEDETIAVQREAFEKRGMSLPYSGNVVSYISPSHLLFICVYVFLPVIGMIYACTPETVKDSLKFTVWRCFSRMKKARKAYACGVFTSCILWPLKRFGVIGCVLFPLWLILVPFLFIALFLEVIPMVNLTFRYVVNFWYYMYKCCCPLPGSDNPGRVRRWFKMRVDSIIIIQPDESQSRGQRFTLAIALAITLLCMWLVLLLVGECLSFYVECVVYLLIGFILDPGRAMKLLSVIMLISVYGHQSCTGVYKKYASYCKSIHQQLQDLLEEQLKEVALLTEEEQENTSFRIPPDEKKPKNERLKLVTGSEGQLKWNASRLVLFLDKEDIPYIPKKLLFELANMKHYYCPGKIHMLYLWAMYDFSKILTFLLFVFVVIFAFGQTNNVSSGRQSIAALGSGFLPLMLKKFLFENEGVNKSNLRWYGMFRETLQKFSDRWHPVDIHVSKVHAGLYVPEEIESISEDQETFVDAKDTPAIEHSESNGIAECKTETNECNYMSNMSDVKETDTLLPPPTYDSVNDNKQGTLTNGSVKGRKSPLERIGSESMLMGDNGLPNDDSDVDLIVLFTKDDCSEESIDFYLQKKKKKEKDEDIIVMESDAMEAVIDMPYTEENV